MLVVGEGRWLFYGKVSGESSLTQKKRAGPSLLGPAPGLETGNLIVLPIASGTFLIIIIDQAAATATAVFEVKFTETIAKAQGNITRLERPYTALIEGRAFQFVLEFEEFLEGLT